MMMTGKSMPSKGMPSDDSMMDDGQEEDEGSKDSMSSKLLAMQNILDNLGDIVGEDMKPYIEQAKQSMHLQSQDAGSDDDMGEEPEMDDEGQPKSGLDVSIGLGGKPPMSEESDEDDDNMPKKGFLAILAKRMKNK